MIASVRGPVIEVALDHAVIEAAGVGYRVNATPATLATLTRGSEALLLTAMIVREDAMTLYGFADPDARELFGVLQTVSGVGPRVAMSVLSVLEPDALRTALVEGDHKTLTRVPGIGKRVAERLVVELRDKVGPAAAPAGATPTAAPGGKRGQLVEALVGLGFSERAAEPAVDAVIDEQPDADTSTLLRSALNSLARTR